jgi:hypothetical protein
MSPTRAGTQIPPGAAAVIHRFNEMARVRVERKSQVETRWLEDIRQIYGMYDQQTMSAIKSKSYGGSQVFMNITRPKLNALTARIWDLLFPTDDRNWSVAPSPVPELSEQAKESQLIAADARIRADEARRQADTAQGENRGEFEMAEDERLEAEAVGAEAEEAAAMASEVLDEIRRASEMMSLTIEDQLNACRYSAQCRDVIEDGCSIGTGVLKGPVVGASATHRWVTTDSGWNLEQINDNAPAVTRVDPWHFFPDPDATSVEDGEGVLERHLMTKQQLRRLAKRPGFNKDAIRSLIENKEMSQLPAAIVNLYTITGETAAASQGTPLLRLGVHRAD